MNNKVGAAIFGLLLVAAAGSVAAQVPEKGIYIGGSLGYSQYKDSCKDLLIPCDENDTIWRAFAGYQFNRYWAMEIGGGHFGEAEGQGTVAGLGSGSFSLKAYGMDVSAIGTVPLSGGLSVFGRLGVYRARTTLDQEGTFFAATHDAGTNSGWLFGAGLGYDLWRLGIRVEWLRYANIGASSVGTDEIDAFSAGVLFRF
jgi:OmpA-OmpF porin, OOP family